MLSEKICFSLVAKHKSEYMSLLFLMLTVVLHVKYNQKYPRNKINVC